MPNASVVGQHGFDLRLVRLEGWDHVAVHQVDGGDGQLLWVKTRPGMALVTVDRRLKIKFSHALERADKEGIHRHQRPGMRCVYVAFAELRAEALKPARLFLR